MAKEVARQMIQNGKVTKVYLGLMIQEIEIHPRLLNFHRLNNIKALLELEIVPVEKN